MTYGNFFDLMAETWDKCRDDPNILIVWYEDLVLVSHYKIDMTLNFAVFFYNFVNNFTVLFENFAALKQGITNLRKRRFFFYLTTRKNFLS